MPGGAASGCGAAEGSSGGCSPTRGRAGWGGPGRSPAQASAAPGRPTRCRRLSLGRPGRSSSPEERHGACRAAHRLVDGGVARGVRRSAPRRVHAQEKVSSRYWRKELSMLCKRLQSANNELGAKIAEYPPARDIGEATIAAGTESAGWLHQRQSRRLAACSSRCSALNAAAPPSTTSDSAASSFLARPHRCPQRTPEQPEVKKAPSQTSQSHQACSACSSRRARDRSCARHTFRDWCSKTSNRHKFRAELPCQNQAQSQSLASGNQPIANGSDESRPV